MVALRRSLLFSFMDRYAGIVIGMAMTMASARMLTPADFGVFAVGMSVIMLIDVLRDFGAGNYLVQLEVLERSAVRSAFTVSCIISGSCAAALALAAIPLGHFYGEPGVGRCRARAVGRAAAQCLSRRPPSPCCAGRWPSASWR